MHRKKSFSYRLTGKKHFILLDFSYTCYIILFLIVNLYVMNTTISSSLTENSETFSRPFAKNYRFYYEECEVTATVNGTYILESDGSIDTYVLFYKDNFYPESLLINLSMIDDDSNALNQFKLNLDLLFGKLYVLVLTTLRTLTIENYTS
jgi:hypothetical protein